MVRPQRRLIVLCFVVVPSSPALLRPRRVVLYSAIDDFHLPPPLEAESALERCLLEVRDTGDSTRGYGLFSREALRTGTWLGNYEGEELTYKQYTARYPLGNSSYTFLISDQAQRRDRRFVDAQDPGKSNLMRFINHSKSAANVHAHVTTKQRRKSRSRKDETDENEAHIRLTACKAIGANEELLLDYGPLYTPALAWDDRDSETADSNQSRQQSVRQEPIIGHYSEGEDVNKEGTRQRPDQQQQA